MSSFSNQQNYKTFLLFYLVCFFSLVIYFAPQPDRNAISSPDFKGSQILLRAASGPFHTLLADRFWLLSGSLSEAPSDQAEKKDSRPFLRTMQTIAILDPGYLGSLRYGSTYLASIYRDVDQAHELLNSAIDFQPDLSDLHLLKISLEMGYQNPPRYQLIQEWTAQIEQIDGSVPEWLGGASLYAREREIKRTLHKEDLKFLEAQATSQIEKKVIADRLAELDAS